MKKIFPKEIIENTTQYFIPKNSVKSKAIYSLILILVIGGFLSMPFIQIPIYSSARGFIKPNIERLSITSINPGKVIFSNMQDNRMVLQGDTLILLETAVLDKRIELNEVKIEIVQKEINDLEYLISNKNLKIKTLKTPKYQKQLIEYQSTLTEHYTRIKKLKEDFKRNRKLLNKGVIAQVEFDEIKLKYDLAENSLYQLMKRQVSIWQTSLSESINLLSELDSNTEQVLGDKKSYVLKAPMKGVLINTQSLHKGGFVNAGVVLGEITPDTELIAECYVSTSDIGLIDKNKEVKFQIDAFNYNQWGFAYGEITKIADDVEIIENRPVYKIQCKLKTKTLNLKNGYKGEIGKGMTLNARFQLTERTLYQLLYDKMDDWLNPSGGNVLAYNK